MEYTSAVLSLFDNLAHAGVAPDLQTAIYADRASRTRLMFSASMAGREIMGSRFSATGCPHVLAACEYTCCALEVQKWPTRAELMVELNVPTEKTGRILLIEDALAELRSAVMETRV